MYKVLRWFLFKLDPERSHDVVKSLLRWLMPACLVRRRRFANKPCRLFGVDFPNPVGMAAGMDKQGEAIDAWFGFGFGFIELGGVTPLPQPGRLKPRLHRFPELQALTNYFGFNSRGVDYLLDKIKARRLTDRIIGVNITHNSATAPAEVAADYAGLIRKLSPWVDYFTVNISCPNTDPDNLHQKDPLMHLLQAIKKVQLSLECYVPCLVKLSPDLTETELTDSVRVIEALKFDGIVATNASNALKPRIKDLPNGAFPGGLSGAPIFSNTLKTVKKIRALTTLPLIAVGGICSTRDALTLRDAGADMVQLMTGLVYEGPKLVRDILAAW